MMETAGQAMCNGKRLCGFSFVHITFGCFFSGDKLSIGEGEGIHDGSLDWMCIIDDEESTGTSKDVASAACVQATVDPMEIIDSDTELNPQEDSQVPSSKGPVVSAETQEASSDLPVGEQTFGNPQLVQLMCIDSDPTPYRSVGATRVLLTCWRQKICT